MYNTKKNNNFLQAIQKYANQQKEEMALEVEQFKTKEMKKAEEEGLRDAYHLIQQEISLKRGDITRQLAQREQESLKELFTRRKELTCEIFEEAKQRLQKYAKTQQYKEQTINSAKKMAELFAGSACALYISGNDKELVPQLSACFPEGNAVIETVPDITIGGIKGVCKSMNIIADSTLDSKLEQQLIWFKENSSLKVI